MLEDVVRKGELLDLYGSLLTEKQRSSMEMYYLADWSLGEIAEELSVSRQAVHDNLHRAGLGLEEYETKIRTHSASEGTRLYRSVYHPPCTEAGSDGKSRVACQSGSGGRVSLFCPQRLSRLL